MFGINLNPKYIIRHAIVRRINNGKISISNNTNLSNVKLICANSSKIVIEDNCVIKNADIYVEKGSFTLKNSSIIFGSKFNKVKIIISDGELLINDHSKLSCKRIWIRFGGKIEIGSYTNINEGSEIRCDEKIDIGSYNQISYNVKIWDTNTHSILNYEDRRKVTEKYYPYFGYEEKKPITMPIIIENDCWIGENSVIMKGTKIGNKCILGYGTFLSGKIIPDCSKVITERKSRINNIQS